jgi:hypothetical protein
MSLSELLTEHYAWVDVLLSLKYNQYALNAETAGEFTTMGLLKDKDEDKDEEQDTSLLERKRSKPVLVYVSAKKRRTTKPSGNQIRIRCQSPIPAFKRRDTNLSDDDWVPSDYSEDDLSIDWAAIEEW